MIWSTSKVHSSRCLMLTVCALLLAGWQMPIRAQGLADPTVGSRDPFAIDSEGYAKLPSSTAELGYSRVAGPTEPVQQAGVTHLPTQSVGSVFNQPAPYSAAAYWNPQSDPYGSYRGGNVPGSPAQYSPAQYSPARQPAAWDPTLPTPGSRYTDRYGIINTQTTPEDEWPETTPLEAFLVHALRKSWVRVDYLLWNIKKPGNVLLGAPIAGVSDPRQPFTVTQPTPPFSPLGTARVPDLNGFNLNNNNGIRLTTGVPLMFGTLETSGFLLSQSSHTEIAGDLPSPATAGAGVFVGTSLLDNGVASTIVQLYDTSYESRLTSEIWGAQSVVVFDTAPPGEGLKLQPLAGAGVLIIRENLTQRGRFTDIQGIGPAPVDLTSVIGSDASNNIYGVILGGRLELVHRWFTLGVEPKFLLGADSFRARVKTENLRSVTDGTVTTEEKQTIFSPVLDVAAYARVHISDRFSMHIGYNVIWAARITRPFDNIVYNDNGALSPPAVVVDANITDTVVHGLVIGGELKFR